jgi:RNA polymerase sigma factor (sigma-70 family)
MVPTDSELLGKYAREGCETSFRHFVERHLALVRSVVVRRGAGDWADEVAMNVFALVARKASDLSRRESLAGWLVMAARRQVSQVRRAEARRLKYEQRFSEEEPSRGTASASAGNEVEALWMSAGPWLDDALAALPTGEREAVLLHYYEGLPFRVVGEKLGRGEDAARKRVGRALERMSAFLQRHGVALSVAALASGLGQHLAEAGVAGASGAAPLAAAALRAAPQLSSVSVFTSSLALMSQTSAVLPVAAVAALLFVLGGGGFWVGHQRSQAAARMRAADVAMPSAAVGLSHAGGVTSPAPSQTPVDPLRRIVQSVVAFQREVRTQPSRVRDVRALLESVAPDQFPGFLRLLDAECAGEKDIHSVLEQYAIQHWARHPGCGLPASEEAARRSPDPKGEGYLWGALMGWGSHDAEGAMAWLKARHGLGEDVRQRFVGSIFEGWVAVDPVPAIQAAAALPYDHQRVAVAWLPRGFWDEKSRPAYIEAAAAAPDPRFRAELMQRTLITSDPARFPIHRTATAGNDAPPRHLGGDPQNRSAVWLGKSSVYRRSSCWVSLGRR